jgi:hypothetical protein
MVKQYGKNEKEQNRKRREMKRGESFQHILQCELQIAPRLHLNRI